MAPPLLRIAARNVRRNWRHGLGSILAISVGFVALGLFGGYLDHLRREVVDTMAERFMLGSLAIERAGVSEAMAGSPAETLELGEVEQAFVDEYLRTRAGEVAARARLLQIWGQASAGQASALFAGWGHDTVDGAALRGRFAWDVVAGRPLQLEGPESAVLGKGLGALLGCEPGSGQEPAGAPPGALARPLACRRPRVQLVASTVSGQINAVEPEVVGLVDAGVKALDARHVAMPLELAQRLRNTRGVTLYSVKLREPSRAAAFSRELVEAARARGLTLEAMPWQEHAMGTQARRGMQLLDTFRALMTLVVVTIAGMSVFTTMVKLVSERTREIGTLRSLGVSRRQVVALFAAEAALLAGLASAIGLVVTLLIAWAVNGAGISYQSGLLAEPIPLGVALDPAGSLRAALFLATVSVGAAVLPARRAARLSIPAALAHA